MSRKWFGTDGIRGVAGEFPLDPATVTALGIAAGEVLGRRGATALVAIDTRESGPWIAVRLMEGLEASGVQCHYAGVLPTPAVAHLAFARQHTLGAVISASHNPYRDNGIKFFGPSGFKLADETEAQIERVLERVLETGVSPGADAEPPAAETVCAEAYLEWLLAKWRGPDLAGWRVVLDCAHGAAARLAPQLFTRLGAEVRTVGCAPDGRNINEGCGSLHPEGLAAAVREAGARLGFAFDGDADRCLTVTGSGRLLDGDYLLYPDALRRRIENRLPGGWVVGTVMSNLWLEHALLRNRLRFYRAAVGDRYVLSCLQDRGGVLGGEPSGHLLFLDEVTTGDGLFTGMVAAMHARLYGGAEALATGIEPFPQTLRNLRVARRADLTDNSAVQAALRAEEEALGGDGRVVLRFSGTEPVLRLMVEARTQALVDGALARLTAVLHGELGEA